MQIPLDNARRPVYFFVMARVTTQEAIVTKGAAIVHEKGFRGAGLQEILRASGIPKGSFYFYFRNKDEFGLALLEHYWGMIRSLAERFLEDPGAPPLVRLERYMDAYREMFADMGFRRGCPVGNLAQEMSDLNEPFRERISEIYAGMHGLIAKVLEEAQRRGELSPGLDAGKAAWFILDGWEGAIMHMKLSKSGEPLEIFKKMLFECVLKTGA